MRIKGLTIAIGLALVSMSGHAVINPIPEESGFSGFGMAGAGYSQVDSNLIVGPHADDEARIDSLDSQASSNGVKPAWNLDVRYTLAEKRTQFYLGNLVYDAVRADYAQQLGVRSELGRKGIGSIAYVTSGLPGRYAGQVWKDPYQTGSDREETDRQTKGIRLGWDGVWGSNFTVDYSYRKVSIDDEQSGDSLSTLTDVQRASLDRNGDISTVDVAYKIAGLPGSTLTPALSYTRNQADGDASSYKRYLGQLTYAFMVPKYGFTTSVFAGKTEFDQANPVFGELTDSDDWGVSASFMWHKLAGVEKLSAIFSASYVESNSDVDFFDSDVGRYTAGLMYKF